MRPTFERWLSQPSTLCFLRRLLSNDDILVKRYTRSISTTAASSQQSQQSSNHAGNESHSNSPPIASERVDQVRNGRSLVRRVTDINQRAELNHMREENNVIGKTAGDHRVADLNQAHDEDKMVRRVIGTDRVSDTVRGRDGLTRTERRNWADRRAAAGDRQRQTKRTEIAELGHHLRGSRSTTARRPLGAPTAQFRDASEFHKAEAKVAAPGTRTALRSRARRRVDRASKRANYVIDDFSMDDLATNLFSTPAQSSNDREISSGASEKLNRRSKEIRTKRKPAFKAHKAYDGNAIIQQRESSARISSLTAAQAQDARRRELYDEVAQMTHELSDDYALHVEEQTASSMMQSKEQLAHSSSNDARPSMPHNDQEKQDSLSSSNTPDALDSMRKVLDEEGPSPEDAQYQGLRLSMLHNGEKRQPFLDRMEIMRRTRDEDGVIKIWTELDDSSYCLPVHKLDSRTAWHTILEVGVVRAFTGDDQFLEKVYSQLKAVQQIHNQALPKLHEWVVGLFLQLRSLSQDLKPVPHSSTWHARLVKDGFAAHRMLINLVENVTTKEALLEFKMACDQQSSGSLIEKCVREAERIHSHDPAFIARWQQLLIEQSTTPADAERSTDRRYSRRKLPFTRLDMTLAMGETHGIDEKTFSDEFCARIAATSMLSVSTSIKCLQFLGVTKLGPITIQQLAMRAGTQKEVLQILNTLSQAGLLNSALIYVRLLRHFAINDARLLEVFLASDQHPQEYEDSDLQRNLIRSFCDQQEWDRAHIAASAAAYKQDFVVDDFWNGLLHSAARKKDLREINHLLTITQLHKIKISEDTMRSIQQNFWQPRAPGKMLERSAASMKSVIVITNALMQYATTGGRIDPGLWGEMLTRFGMTNHTDEMYRLATWLADHYNPEKNLGKMVGRYGQMVEYLKIVFSSTMLKALVIWMWRAAAYENQLQENSKLYTVGDVSLERWALGIHLARKVSPKDPQDSRLAVRKAVAQQLWTIFGPLTSDRKVNRLVQRHNKLSMKHYILHIESIWPGVLSRSERGIGLLEEEGLSNAELLVGMFGPRRSQPGSGGIEDEVMKSNFRWTVSEEKEEK